MQVVILLLKCKAEGVQADTEIPAAHFFVNRWQLKIL